MRPSSLPEFERPPVVEVALSLQFEEIPDFRSIHLGLLWQKLGIQNFPTFEEQPPVPETLERFGPGDVNEPPRFQLLEVPPIPRYFFVSKDQTKIVQVQPNRLTVNWRKRREEDVYPRFEAIEDFFIQQRTALQEFLKEHNLGSIENKQAELTYVNRIQRRGDGWKLKQLLSVFSGTFTDNFLQEPEEAFVSLHFPVLDAEQRIGRLYVDLRPEVPGDKESDLRMMLLVRGRPSGLDEAAAIKFFHIARNYIVSGFTSVTSTEAHKEWGRKPNAGIAN